MPPLCSASSPAASSASRITITSSRLNPLSSNSCTTFAASPAVSNSPTTVFAMILLLVLIPDTAGIVRLLALACYVLRGACAVYVRARYIVPQQHELRDTLERGL